MIKSLRRNFIMIAMSSMTLVLAIIIICINIANYINVCQTADERIALISNNGGTFPDKDDMDETPPELSGDGAQVSETPSGSLFRSDRHDISAEAEFDTRYFTVTITEDGTISQIDTGNIAGASTDDASNYAMHVWSRNKTSGFIDCYRYQAISTTTSSGTAATMYIFLNSERELSTFHSFLLASIGISILGLLLVFTMVLFFSKKALQPVAESYEKQKRFITDASHEIKTPLTIIDANTEVIEMTTGENQWTKSTKKQIARLTALTERLVFLSRMDEESTRIEMQSFNLSDAILDTAEPFEAVAASKEKSLTLDIAPDITIKGDEATLRQLVSLLLDNAIKYSSEHGSIRLSFHSTGKTHTLTVWNTTEPMEPGRHDELFERFYRMDPSRNSQTGGYGIGLSVAKAIVAAHKGKITAKSSDGQSLMFVVTL